MLSKKIEYEFETKIIYKIYEIREGLLKEPTESRYGGKELIFDEYTSMEAAREAINDTEDYSQDLVVLPIASKNIIWD